MTAEWQRQASGSNAVHAGGEQVSSPWPRVVFVLGVVLIVAAAVVGAVAFWPSTPSQPTSAVPTATSWPPSASPTKTASAVADLSAAELASQFGSAVWRVEAEGCGSVGVATAFAVGPRTLITNAHVVVNDAKPTIVSRDGRRSALVVVAGVDHDLDVAVLVTSQDLPGGSLAWVGAAELEEGEPLVALGYPVPDHSFTVTPASVLIFQTDGRTRQALRLDGLVDKGNSGGPVLTVTGQVAGVVTFLLDTGQHWIGVAHTFDYLADSIRRIERDRPGLTVSCESPPPAPAAPESWEWDDVPDWEVTGPDRYGDDPSLDRLYEACRDGDMAACDDTYWQSPYFSGYESFAASCGGTQPGPVWGYCTWYFDGLDADETSTFGNDPYLDALLVACAEGDMTACDDLYYEAPLLGKPTAP